MRKEVCKGVYVWCGAVWCGVVWCGVVWWSHHIIQMQTKQNVISWDLDFCCLLQMFYSTYNVQCTYTILPEQVFLGDRRALRLGVAEAIACSLAVEDVHRRILQTDPRRRATDSSLRVLESSGSREWPFISNVSYTTYTTSLYTESNRLEGG